MFIKYGIKTNIRTKGRTALFFSLIMMLTVVMTAASGIVEYCNSALRQCDGEFRSIALVEYLPANGSETVSDEASRSAFEALDVEAISAVEGVKRVDRTSGDVFWFDGFTQTARNDLYKDLGVVVVSGIGEPNYREYYVIKKVEDLEEGDEVVSYFTDSDFASAGTSFIINGEEVEEGTEFANVRIVDRNSVYYYSARISYSFYSLSGKSEMLINLIPGESGFVPEPGKSYVMHGVFLGKNSSYGPSNGRESFEITEIRGADEPPFAMYEDMDSVPQIFTDLAAKYLRANNFVFVDYCGDVRDSYVFQQGELYLKEGDFPEPGAVGDCVISADLAKALELQVGDEMTGELLSSSEESRYDLSPTDITGTFRVCGIAAESNDYNGRIWAIGKGHGSTVYGDLFAALSLENKYAEDAVSQISGSLPENLRVTLYDQGYGETVKPFRSIGSAASDIFAVCAAGALASLILYAYVFVGRQGYSVKIMTSLGTPKRGITLWLLSGSGAISGTAAVSGAIIGKLALPGIYEKVSASAGNASSLRKYSELTLGVTHTVKTETGFSPLPAVFCAAGVILISLLLCVFFLRFAYAGSSPKRGKTRVRIPAGKTSVSLRGSLRFAVLSIRRGGRGSLAAPLVSAALTVVIVVLSGVFIGWQTRLDDAYENTVISGHAVSTNGRHYSGLVIPVDAVKSLLSVEGVGDVFVSSSYKYYLASEMPSFSGTSFGQERMEEWKRSGAEVIALNGLRAAKDFYYAEPRVTWLDGWDESFLSDYECVLFRKFYEEDGFSKAVPAVVSEQFMEEHGKSLGDDLTVTVIEDQMTYATTLPIELKIVGSYRQTGGKANIYVPLTCTAPKDIFTLDYKEEPSGDPWMYIYSEDYYIYRRTNFSTCRFTVSSADSLETLRSSLSSAGFSRVGKLGMIRTTIVLEDASFIKLTETLGRYIAMGRSVSVLIFAIAALIGFIVSWLMVNGRKREFALMRGFGAGKARIFFSFFLEQILLCAAGCLVGCISMLIPGGAGGMRWAAVGIYVFFYLAGCAVSTLIISRTRLMDLFSSRE